MTRTHPYIKPYCTNMGSAGWYTGEELDAAKRTNAPADAYASKKGPGNAKTADDWHLVRNMDSYQRERLERQAETTLADLGIIVTDGLPFECPHCHWGFASPEVLQQHIAEKHSEQ